MRTLIVLSVMMFLVPGCYTQLATMESTLPSNEPETVIDSATGDTIKVIRQVDTIISREKQTCVWERDMFGHPYLQCYDSNYPRSWLFYNNTPWWYRNDPYWYDYDRCPRYYQYDPSCGCCRYYDDFRRGGYSNNHRGGGSYRDYNHSSGGSPHSGSSHSGSSGYSGSSTSGSSSSSGAPLTGSSSRTTAQKAPPPPVQNQPSGGTTQKAAEPAPAQQPSSPTPANEDQGTTRQRNTRSLRSR